MGYGRSNKDSAVIRKDGWNIWNHWNDWNSYER